MVVIKGDAVVEQKRDFSINYIQKSTTPAVFLHYYIRKRAHYVFRKKINASIYLYLKVITRA